MLRIDQPVDSLERNTRHMAGSGEAFRGARPPPPTEDEGDLFVVSAEGKGVVIRRGPGDPPPKAHRGQGDKANTKRMALAGGVDSVDRYARTPAEMAATLFRDPRTPGEPVPRRPVPAGKHARVPPAVAGRAPVPQGGKFGGRRVRAGPAGAGAERGGRGVVKGLRRMGTAQGLGGPKKKALATICGYLASKAGRRTDRRRRIVRELHRGPGIRTADPGRHFRIVIS
ncbi:MAG: hypothetical protein JWO38_1526 [Gemmataceae bacterium]|nr:hypothetical protein [Gemmataceae bacterium]